MKKWLVTTAKVLVWLVLMGTYFNLFMMNDKAPFYLDTNWFSSPVHNKPCDGNPLVGCLSVELPIAHTNRGFPILMSGRYTEGPFALAWVINIGFVILVGIALALVLMSKFKKAAITGGIILLTYGILAFIVNV